MCVCRTSYDVIHNVCDSASNKNNELLLCTAVVYLYDTATLLYTAVPAKGV